MANSNVENAIVTAMQPLVDLDVPPVLRSSIEHQSRILMGLATSLLQSGMAESQVRDVIDRACTLYRDELVSAILALRKYHET